MPPAWQLARSEGKWTNPAWLWIGETFLMVPTAARGQKEGFMLSAAWQRELQHPTLLRASTRNGQSHCHWHERTHHCHQKEKEQKPANHEKLKILAACRLHEGEWDQVPPTHEDNTTEDGRTCLATRGCHGTGAPVCKHGCGFPFLSLLFNPASV